ncbi:MAG: SprT family zinc-dependent metalloprotease [Dinoroseobacter sp.]|nr:SprT family zinc-dependent metalloprotease [Dinoroseobacter sp.]MDJ0991983.1 SprT family zinc-dependent metalloprotease [Dinoroseobacter sp.]
MTEIELPGSPPASVQVRQSARAKRFTLRVSRLDGRITLTVPPRAPHSEAIAFVKSQADWIRRHLDRHAPAERIRFGARVPVEGRLAKIVPTDARRGDLAGDLIEVPRKAASPGAHVEALLKAFARDRLEASSTHYAQALGRNYNAITLRDTRSRWGSCSSEGRLMYSWRLIMAPPEVLDYVVAHEVSHLAEMNHSPAFWRTVRELYPDYDAPRAWLRREGAALHRYRFRD